MRSYECVVRSASSSTKETATAVIDALYLEGKGESVVMRKEYQVVDFGFLLNNLGQRVGHVQQYFLFRETLSF